MEQFIADYYGSILITKPGIKIISPGYISTIVSSGGKSDLGHLKLAVKNNDKKVLEKLAKFYAIEKNKALINVSYLIQLNIQAQKIRKRFNLDAVESRIKSISLVECTNGVKKTDLIINPGRALKFLSSWDNLEKYSQIPSKRGYVQPKECFNRLSLFMTKYVYGEEHFILSDSGI